MHFVPLVFRLDGVDVDQTATGDDRFGRASFARSVD